MLGGLESVSVVSPPGCIRKEVLSSPGINELLIPRLNEWRALLVKSSFGSLRIGALFSAGLGAGLGAQASDDVPSSRWLWLTALDDPGTRQHDNVVLVKREISGCLSYVLKAL